METIRQECNGSNGQSTTIGYYNFYRCCKCSHIDKRIPKRLTKLTIPTRYQFALNIFSYRQRSLAALENVSGGSSTQTKSVSIYLRFACVAAAVRCSGDNLCCHHVSMANLAARRAFMWANHCCGGQILVAERCLWGLLSWRLWRDNSEEGFAMAVAERTAAMLLWKVFPRRWERHPENKAQRVCPDVSLSFKRIDRICDNFIHRIYL